MIIYPCFTYTPRNIIVLPRIHGFLDMLLKLESFKLVLKVTHNAIRWALWLDSPHADINLLLNHPKDDGLMYWTFRLLGCNLGCVVHEWGLQAITFIGVQLLCRESGVSKQMTHISYGVRKEFDLFILQTPWDGMDEGKNEMWAHACITCSIRIICCLAIGNCVCYDKDDNSDTTSIDKGILWFGGGSTCLFYCFWPSKWHGRRVRYRQVIE